MKTRSTIIISLIAIGLFSCTETTETTTNENVEVSSKSDEETKADKNEIPEINSFTDKSTFTITTEDGEINEFTETNTLDIFVNNKLLNSPIKITNELNYSEVDLGTKGVPENAVFAFSTWYAGGGAVYYGIVKDGILQINQKFEDEQMEKEEQFTLFLEIDPNKQISE